MPSRRRRNRTHKLRGGFNPKMAISEVAATFSQSPNSVGANTWVESQYGNTNQQYNDVFGSGSQTLGNTFTKLPLDQTPNPESLNLIQSAGKKHRIRAGMGLGTAAATAAVPLSLLYLQNRYGKKNRSKKYSYKKRRGGKASRKSRKGKGGFTGVISNAIVPFGLLGLQQRYGKRSKTAKRSRSGRK